jgi:hypothetical protein
LEYRLTYVASRSPRFWKLYRNVADQRGIRASIVEKDYWVTYVLQALRQEPEFKEGFVFKGGTSLSKGWGLIDRFSEDIDLLLLSDGLSLRKKRNRLKNIEQFVGGLAGLSFDQEHPGNKEGGNEARTSCFEYQIGNKESIGSLLPYIKLEMGYHGGIEPTEFRPIQSFIGQQLEETGNGKIAENIASLELPLLHPKRTFTEKLFALYSNCESREISGKTRHYYDLYKLLGREDVQTFLGGDDKDGVNPLFSFTSEIH